MEPYMTLYRHSIPGNQLSDHLNHRARRQEDASIAEGSAIADRFTFALHHHGFFHARYFRGSLIQNLVMASLSEEGIELLAGVPRGEADADGAYPGGSVNARVMTVLVVMGEKLRDPESANSPSRDSERHLIIEELEGRERDPREGPGAPPTPPSKADR